MSCDKLTKKKLTPLRMLVVFLYGRQPWLRRWKDPLLGTRVSFPLVEWKRMFGGPRSDIRADIRWLEEKGFIHSTHERRKPRIGRGIFITTTVRSPVGEFENGEET
jgi:hypothetical protein